MFWRIKSLQTRLMLVFLAVLFIPLTATALYGHVFARDMLSGHAVERFANQVRLQAESIVSSLRQAQGDALYLTELRSLRMLNQQIEPQQVMLWRDEVAQDFMVLLSVRPMYGTLRYLDENGVEIVAVHSDGTTVSSVMTLADQQNATYFRNSRSLRPGGVYVSSFALDVNSSQNNLPFLHYAIRPTDGGGLIVIDLHVGWLLRNLPSELNSDTWVLIDQAGRFLVYPQDFDPAMTTDDLSPMLSGTSGSFATQRSVYVYDTIYPTASNPSQFWVLYRETPTNVLFAEMTNFYIAAGGFALVGMSLAVLLAFLMSHRLTKPLAQLEEMTLNFGRGGQAPNVPQGLPQDEIGNLTHTFCDMARELERKRNLEHRLIERLIRAQEEERKLIAFDLHDGLIQQLVGARFYLTKCREKYAETESKDEITESTIRSSCDALTEAIIEGRRIIEGLRPAVLDDLGLVAAIEEIAHAMAQTAQWTLLLNLQTLPAEPEKSVAVTLFRITQEALNNVRKHAHANHVTVALHNTIGISLEVSDDGIGFNPDDPSSLNHSFGVTTMRERAALLGGTCEITSIVGCGTRVKVWVPGTVLLDDTTPPNERTLAPESVYGAYK